ncbi:MAG: sensor histidine kinase [Chloroflexi bacterium]|nr:sensor histidine kinase [Chloroflexota bacterium]
MLDQLIFFVFFVYGLAFFGMGIAMALESGRSPALVEARVLRPLAAFGLIHGTHEWMESYLLQARSFGTYLPSWLPWVRLVLLASSFASLMLFAYHLLRLVSPRYDSKRIIHLMSFSFYSSAILISAYLTYRVSAISWFEFLDGLSRYLLAVPASVLSAIALRARARQANREKLDTLASNFFITALGFGIYALTQFVVHPMEMFPAQIINEQAFLEFTGFPIQIVRTLTAVLITIGLLRATFVMDKERKKQLFAAQQMRLEALQEQENLRRDLLTHTVHAQEEERARIARELHDETSQVLSGFSLELAALQSMLKRNKTASVKVEHLQNLSRQISQGIYRLVHDLRPAQLDDLGLVAALRYLLGQYHAAEKIDVAFKVGGDVRRLDPLLETILFRVAQEALANIVRHAGTRNASLELCFEGDHVHLTVADQGQGFDADGRFAAPRGWGLAGMRERIESVGGDFILKSVPGAGTTIEVIVPLNKKQEI